MGSHYILKQKGGWVHKKNNQLLNSKLAINYYKFQRLINAITAFNLKSFCKKNSPKSDFTYTSFGVFCIISTVCTMYSLSHNMDNQTKLTILPLYEIILVLSVCFMTYPIWPSSLKKDFIIQILWNISIFFLLIFSSSFFLILSSFSHLQFVVFISNFIVAAVLTRWKVLFYMTTIGVYLSIITFKYYANIDNIIINTSNTSLIIYTFLLVGTSIVIFLNQNKSFKKKQNKNLIIYLIN